jgi:tetratricopeptide (TPR) repeat protein
MNELDYITRGISRCQAEDYHGAIQDLQTGLKQEPSHADAVYYLARAHFMLQQHLPALGYFERAVVLQPANARFHSEMGVVYFHLGRYAESLESMNRAVVLEPYNPYRYSSRAFIRDASGDLKGAIEDYRKAIEIDPDDAVAQNNLGLLEEKLGYKKSAEKRFIRADELAKQMGYTFTNPKITERQRDQAETAAQAEIKGESPVELQEQNEVNNSDSATPQLSFAQFLHTAKDVLTSAETRKDFGQFVRNLLNRKKD